MTNLINNISLMKRILPLALMALAITSAPVATASAERIDPVTVEDSGCLNTRSNSQHSPDYDADAWSITYVNGILTVTWENFVANCCPYGFTTWVERNGSNLVFNIQENSSLCDCVCAFNVTSTFGSIEPGHYTITFRRYGEYIFSGAIDLKEGSAISWAPAQSGIRTVGPANDLITLAPEGMLHITADKEVTVEIYDAAGMIRFRMDSDSNSDIDIKSLPKGIYIAKASDGVNSATLRFIR